MTITEISRRLGVSRQTAISWANGSSIPRVHHAQALQELLGIPSQDWVAEQQISKVKNPVVVYFLQRGKNGPIKIGFSRNPKQRITAIQAYCAEKLRVLLILPADAEKREKAIHEQFQRFRLKGEWFEPSQDLCDWIREQRKVRGRSRRKHSDTVKPVEQVEQKEIFHGY